MALRRNTAAEALFLKMTRDAGKLLTELERVVGADVLNDAEAVHLYRDTGGPLRVSLKHSTGDYTARIDADSGSIAVVRIVGGRYEVAEGAGDDLMWHLAAPAGDPGDN
jgi:hypothetical protein